MTTTVHIDVPHVMMGKRVAVSRVDASGKTLLATAVGADGAIPDLLVYAGNYLVIEEIEDPLPDATA
jgi:hypothetical protein